MAMLEATISLQCEELIVINFPNFPGLLSWLSQRGKKIFGKKSISVDRRMRQRLAEKSHSFLDARNNHHLSASLVLFLCSASLLSDRYRFRHLCHRTPSQRTLHVHDRCHQVDHWSLRHVLHSLRLHGVWKPTRCESDVRKRDKYPGWIEGILGWCHSSWRPTRPAKSPGQGDWAVWAGLCRRETWGEEIFGSNCGQKYRGRREICHALFKRLGEFRGQGKNVFFGM